MGSPLNHLPHALGDSLQRRKTVVASDSQRRGEDLEQRRLGLLQEVGARTDTGDGKAVALDLLAPRADEVLQLEGDQATLQRSDDERLERLLVVLSLASIARPWSTFDEEVGIAAKVEI